MKKFLALVLALVMTMSLVTISAGAEDYTDVDNINYVEAVDVVSALGIVGGYADGSFGPNGTLTRGAAAKIICNLILGTTTASALSADTAPYKDVPVDHTFAGYIAYCQSEGIISGYADGTFKPAANLTGYAFMKMLLGCLGYDATLENYVGANWSVNVAKRALAIGLDDGMLDDFNGTKPVTRQEAALFAFNTLKAGIVSYDTKGTNITIGDTTINTGASEPEYTNTADSGYDNTLADSFTGGRLQFAEKHFPKLTRSNGGDAFLRPSNTWYYKGVKIGSYANNATLSYTGDVKGGDIFADLGMSTKDDVPMVYFNGVMLNGSATTAPMGDTDGNGSFESSFEVAKNNDVKLSHVNGRIGNGTLVEVFLDKSSNNVTVNAMSVYAGEVTKVKAAEGAKEAYAVVGFLGSDNGTAPSYYHSGAYNSKFETDVFEVDDIVAFTYSEVDNGIVDMYAMDSVTGTLDKVVSTKSINLDGTTYKFAEEYLLDGGAVVNNQYVAYLDANGYVLYTALADATVENYAFVKAIASESGVTSNQAKLVFTDGTIKTVSLYKDYANESGTKKINPNTIVAYTENNGVYKLSNTDFDSNDTTSVNVNDHKLTANGLDTQNIDSKTVFVVENNGALKVFTGAKNVPDVADNAPSTTVSAYALTNTRGNMNRVVFLFGGKITATSEDIVFVAGKSVSKLTTDRDENQFYNYNAVVNGEITTIMVDTGVGFSGTKANQIFNTYTTDDGIIDTVTGFVPGDVTVPNGVEGDTGIRKYSSDEVRLGNTNASYAYYNVSSDVNVYVIDGDGNITEIEFVEISADTNDLITFTEEDGEITNLFIQEVKG